MYKTNSEEELKHKVYQDYFRRCEYIPDYHKIDIALKYNNEQILWCEAKNKAIDIDKMFAQLIFTIYKIHNDYFTPKYLCVFDIEKIAFITYEVIEPLFDAYKNADFDWTVTPSNYNTKEFKKISSIIKDAVESKQVMFEHSNLYDFKQTLFYFSKHKEQLKEWIDANILVDIPSAPLRITGGANGNVNRVYNAWVDEVKCSIDEDWDAIRNDYGILDCDYFLADLFSKDNMTLTDKLFVLLQSNQYKMTKEINKQQRSAFNTRFIYFNDNQKAHTQFWSKYKRPPEEEYWDLILSRRDLFVPRDIRERLGAFFTPPQWVKLSQQYLRDCFGENFEDEYYIWDCAGGTGNLLDGLNNPRNIFCSDVNIENVYVTRGRIEDGKLNLLPNHIFQFDFLNDDFDEKTEQLIPLKDSPKLPERLRNIIANEPEKLIIYINPPYAEDTIKSNFIKIRFKGNVAKNKIHNKYEEYLKKANHELFAQFLVRIYFEIPGCKIGTFSTMKSLVAPNFKDFRKFFLANLKKCFIIPANTFDNVEGQFPIGFQVWDTKDGKHFKSANVNVYNAEGKYIGKKKYRDGVNIKYINDWMNEYRIANSKIGCLSYVGNDFQHHNFVTIENSDKGNVGHYVKKDLDANNIIIASIYFSVRKVIKATWLNDRDQFLYPNNKWEKDLEFQNDCLTYAVFNTNIQSRYGINHWIPFTEKEVGVKEAFDSSFMVDFINGKIKIDINTLYKSATDTSTQLKREFSKEATAVFEAGRELWKYYHTTQGKGNRLIIYDAIKYNVNASLYDIRECFQGRNDKGRMKVQSSDEQYSILIKELRDALKILAQKIEPKVYEYGFLM